MLCINSWMRILENVLFIGMPGTAEPTLENNPETKNYPPVIGNDDDQCPSSSSANSSSDSSEFQIMHITSSTTKSGSINILNAS